MVTCVKVDLSRIDLDQLRFKSVV